MNSRLDEIQAAMLDVKLKYLDRDTNRRRDIAARYCAEIDNSANVLPNSETRDSHAWHVFVIRCDKREKLQKYLLDKGVQTLIHYPIPPHKQEAYPELSGLSLPITERIHDEVLSLPMGPHLSNDDVTTVIEAISGFNL